MAVEVAGRLKAHIVSADSRQVYRDMDIGTGKDLNEYVYQGAHIPYHLINIAEPGTRYTVFNFQRDFLSVYRRMEQEHCDIVMCGGSGLYIESVLRAYRLTPVPEAPLLRANLKDKSLHELTQILSSYKPLHNTTDVDTARRAIRAIEIAEYYKSHPRDDDEFPRIDSLTIGISIPREERRRRISQRLHSRLENGMIDEVRSLIQRGISPDVLISYGLEYRYITLYLLGKLTRAEMEKQLETAIHRFAKRQMTYFRGMERRGVKIHWINGEQPTQTNAASILSLYREHLSRAASSTPLT